MNKMEEMRICWIIELAGWFQLADFSSGGGKNFGLLSFTETLGFILFPMRNTQASHLSRHQQPYHEYRTKWYS